MTSVVGLQIGDLVVLQEGHKISKEGWKISTVEVKCECGNVRWIRKTELTNGRYLNCKQGAHGKNVVDLRNKSFGEWKVISYDGDGKWKCQCSCGTLKSLKSAELTNSKSKSCGCKRFEYMAKTNTLPNNKSQKNKILNTYKKHAQSRNLEFKLTAKEFEQLIIEDCYYCGIQPSNIKNPDSVNKYGNISPFRYNGIDRVDSSVGYTIENCVSCCKLCNRSKGELPLNEWKEWIGRIFKHLEEIQDETQLNFNDRQLQAKPSQSIPTQHNAHLQLS